MNATAQSVTVRTDDDPGAHAVPVAVVLRAAGGDAQAFGALYEATVDRIHRYVWLRVHDDGVAADLTQDIYVSALRGLDRLDAPERFEAWLLRIAHNRVVNHWVSSGRRRHDVSLDAAGGSDDPSTDGPVLRHLADPAAVALDEAAERTLRLADLTHHLSVLSDAQQDVLALRFGAGLSLSETAAQLERTELAIKQLQRRALVTLRARLRAGDPRAGDTTP